MFVNEIVMQRVILIQLLLFLFVCFQSAFFETSYFLIKQYNLVITVSVNLFSGPDPFHKDGVNNFFFTGFACDLCVCGLRRDERIESDLQHLSVVD